MQVHSLDFVMVKHREDTSNEEMKETIGEEDEEESNTNINVPPAANVDAEEEPQENVVNRMKDLSECLTKEQGDEISTTNENKKEIHASNMDKLKNSPLAETFQENMHNKESETTDEKMNGLERENQKAAELSTPKDKAEDIEDEKQQMKDEVGLP